ncbi:MAG: hypothetical protein CMH63_02385 [Nanoarchaeota archaeon]|jgi:hypothetical protein|nr:hypothetical protein [Nanoarchaeota archaeon]|tara:strand:+ start:2012 stop:2275 length:264 start_codon:yes stop_codon:yes gene_type:complete
MKQITLHQPRLDTVIMIEETIEKYSGECGNFQLWKKLPKSVMYQTFLRVLDYLEYSNKIAIDKEGKLGWIFSPKIYKNFAKRKDLKR